ADLVLRFVCAVDETGCGDQLRFSRPTKSTIREMMAEFARLAAPQDRPALRRLMLDFDEEAPFQDGDYSACALPGIINEYANEVNETDLPMFHELRTVRDDLDLLK